MTVPFGNRQHPALLVRAVDDFQPAMGDSTLPRPATFKQKGERRAIFRLIVGIKRGIHHTHVLNSYRTLAVSVKPGNCRASFSCF